MIVAITPDDVGERVSVRHRIPAGPGEPRHTDVVGYLRAWSEGQLTIERRDGSRARIPESDVVAARAVPPPPARRQ